MNYQEVLTSIAQSLPDDKYIKANISGEEWREVETVNGTYRIENPIALIIKIGGKTHRVVDSEGIVHCYVAPESGRSILRWKPREGTPSVQF